MKKINKGVIGSYYYPGVENYTRYMVARFGMSPLAGDESLKPEYGPVYTITSHHLIIPSPFLRVVMLLLMLITEKVFSLPSCLPRAISLSGTSSVELGGIITSNTKVLVLSTRPVSLSFWQ
jgi:hypothetical protein